jgi:hypothetical protein
MRTQTARCLAALALMALAGLAIAACGEEEELEVIEGEPVEVGQLHYNVQLTRFLNAGDREDSAYLEGEPPEPRGKDYLAVFMAVENDGDEPLALPRELTVTDTRGNVFKPVETKSPFALELGTTVEGGAELPLLDTVAANGPIKGAMVLFLVDEGVAENRPLELEIPSSGGEHGLIELDI